MAGLWRGIESYKGGVSAIHLRDGHDQAIESLLWIQPANLQLCRRFSAPNSAHVTVLTDQEALDNVWTCIGDSSCLEP